MKTMRIPLDLSGRGMRFAALARDFNNMLGVNIGYSDLAMEKAGSSRGRHDNLSEISKAARRAGDSTKR